MGSLIRRNNGIYYGVFTVRGRRVWRSTGMREAVSARAVYREQSREHESWKGMTLTGFLDELQPLIEGKLADSTIRLYKQAIGRLMETMGNIKIKSLTPYHIERFNSERLKVVSATKVRIDYRVLKAAFNRAVRYGMIGRNPCLGCEKPRVPEKSPRFLSRDEADQLLRSIDDPQMRAIVLLALCTAMRLGEIANLQWEDVLLDSGMIKLVNREHFRLKTGKGRVVPLNQLAIGLLAGLPRSTGFVFPSRTGVPYTGGWVSRRFKRYIRKAGLSEELHFHSLRHTGASWLVQQNVPLTYVKEILGHSSVSTTMVYAHSDPQHIRAEMNRAFEQFSPEWLNPMEASIDAN